MSLKSMTGFARTVGQAGATRWAWEVRTVNAKGFDLRLRVPAGFDGIEPAVRARVGQAVTRGTCHATLTVDREAPAPDIRINQAALNALAAALRAVPAGHGLGPATLDGLLAVRGVVETVESADARPEAGDSSPAILAGLDAALTDLRAMRIVEGAALAAVLHERLDRIGRLARAADAAPERQAAAIRQRLARSVADLVEAGPTLDPDRLHQEVVLLAARSDIREEFDRLFAHEAATRDLLASDVPVGRRLDFLAQEFAREANTLCAKANAAALTAIGLDLKVEIEQFREQVQNVE